MDDQDDFFKCIICFEPFTSDPSDPNGIIPVESGVCSHTHKQCLACLRKRGEVSPPRRKWLNCSLCHKEKAFNIEKPIISVYTMNLMQREQQPQRRRQQQHVELPSSTAAQTEAPKNATLTCQSACILDLLDSDDETEYKKISIPELKKKRDAAQKKETRFTRSFYDPHPVNVVATHPNYKKFASRYHKQVRKRQDSASDKSAAVVLDLFAGVGTGLIALKRQGVAIKKYIHVDHDEGAAFVCKSNHTNDGIDHIRIETFKEIKRDLDNIMKQHAPIDIILASPPCVDFTPINASRNGVEGEQGRLMIDVSDLLIDIKLHRLQKKRKVFWFVENIVLRREDLMKVSEAYEMTPLEVDAQFVSPCRRNRNFILNYPVHFDLDGAGAQSDIRTCLEDGWMHPADAIDASLSTYGGRKSNTFMASHTRVDDDRMMIVKYNHEKRYYVQRSISILERERMMGFPKGYISKPVCALFHRLQYDLSVAVPTSDSDLRYRFGLGIVRLSSDHDGSAVLKIAPPTPTGKQPYYYDEEAYAKHLIGNACSVVVMEMLFAPLAKLFPPQQYEDFNYLYPWSPTPIGDQSRTDKQSSSSLHLGATQQKAPPNSNPAAKDKRNREKITVPIGTKFSKLFEDGWYNGEVKNFDENTGLYYLLYEDEDNEEVYFSELQRILDSSKGNVYRFKRIVDHEGPITLGHHNWLGSKYNLLIEWENGDITIEPLNKFADDAFDSCAMYAQERNLLDVEGWKRFAATSTNKRQKKRHYASADI